MTKKQVWDQLDAGWRKAFHKTVERWMRHVRAGGKVRVRTECHLCREGESRPRGVCTECPIALHIPPDGPTFLGWGCLGVASFDKWCSGGNLDAAKGVLRYLLGFLPKDDKLRAQAEALLTDKKAELPKGTRR